MSQPVCKQQPMENDQTDQANRLKRKRLTRERERERAKAWQSIEKQLRHINESILERKMERLVNPLRKFRP